MRRILNSYCFSRLLAFCQIAAFLTSSVGWGYRPDPRAPDSGERNRLLVDLKETDVRMQQFRESQRGENSCYDNPCPEYLIERIKRGKHGTLGIDSAAKICGTTWAESEFKNAADLEDFLSKHPETSLGRKPGQVWACGDGRLNEDQKMTLVASYFSRRKQVISLAKINSESLVSLNSLLSSPSVLEGSACGSVQSIDFKRQCDLYASCKPQGGLDKLAAEAAYGMTFVRLAEAEIHKISMEEARAVESAKRDDVDGERASQRLQKKYPQGAIEKRKQLRAVIDHYYTTYPWTRGQVFRANFKQENWESFEGRAFYREFQEALRLQLEANLKKIVDQNKEIADGADCLMPSDARVVGGSYDQHKCTALEHILDQAPPFQIFIPPGSRDLKVTQANLRLWNDQCWKYATNAKNGAETAITDFVEGAALTVATAGLGVAVRGAKLVTRAGVEMAEALKAGRDGKAALSLGQKIASEAAQISQMSFKGKAALVALQGITVKGAADTISQIYSECDQKLEERTEASDPDLEANSRVAAGDVCPKNGDNYLGPEAFSDWRACRLAAGQAVLMNLLPAAGVRAGIGMARFLPKKTQEILFREVEFKKAQKVAVEKAPAAADAPELPVLQAVHPKADDPVVTPKQRVADVLQRFTTVARENISTKDAGIRRIFGDRSVIPEGGSAHITGPGFNFYEWAIPLLERPDIKITVSDPILHMVLDSTKSNGGQTKYFKDIFEAIKRDKPELLRGRATAMDADSFVTQVEKRIKFIPEAEKGAAPADFVLSRLPHNSDLRFNPNEIVRRLDGALKPGGLVWVIPDPRLTPANFKNLGYPSENLQMLPRSPFSDFLPERGSLGPQSFLEPTKQRTASGTYLGQDHAEGSFIAVKPLKSASP